MRNNNKAIKDAVDNSYKAGNPYQHDDEDSEDELINNRGGNNSGFIPNRLRNLSKGRNNNQQRNKRVVQQEKNNNNKELKKNIQNGNNESNQKTQTTQNSNNNSNSLKSKIANNKSKVMSFLNKRKKKKENKEENTNESSVENTNEKGDPSLSKDEKLKIKVKRKIIIKIAIFAVVVFFAFYFIVLILMVISGGNITISLPIANVNNYEKNDSEILSQKGTEAEKVENDFYKKIDEIKKKYETNHPFNANYLTASLIYLYYNVWVEGFGETGGIDYKKMTSMADTFVKIMKPEADDLDYEINGTVYNRLKESSEFKEYYKEVLKERDIDKILSEIFEIGEQLTKEETDDTVLTEETTVTVKEVSSSSEKGSKETIKNVALNDYLVGVVYANAPESTLNNSEAVKAYTIAYSTNILAENSNITVNSSNATSTFETCDVTYGCSYVEKDGKLVLQTGSGEKSSLNNVFFNGKYYYKKPLTDSEINSLKKSVNDVYGKVLTNQDGSSYQAVSTKNMKVSSGTYTDILNNSYSNHKIKNVGEDTYTNGVNYGNNKKLINVIFYDQTDYSSVKFCGREKATIKTSGCGVTSMAIIVSTYENSKKYDPVMMTQDAYKGGYCGVGINGTSGGFYKKKAQEMNYNYLHVGKKLASDLNLVLSHLSKGHLVIAHMGSGRFTSSGHYMVLGGIDPSNKTVYVYDPYNEINKTKSIKSGNGWYSFNDVIAKEAFDFYIIWKG